MQEQANQFSIESQGNRYSVLALVVPGRWLFISMIPPANGTFSPRSRALTAAESNQLDQSYVVTCNLSYISSFGVQISNENYQAVASTQGLGLKG